MIRQRLKKSPGTCPNSVPVFSQSVSNIEKMAQESAPHLSRGGAAPGQKNGQREPASSPQDASSLETAKRSEQHFRQAAARAMEAQMLHLKRYKELRAQILAVQEEFDKSEALITDLRQSVESGFSANEERAKTKVQAGAASVDDLNSIIQDFYDKDFPLIQSAYRLQEQLKHLRQCLLLLQDDSGSNEKLAESRKSFQEGFSALTSRLKRTVRRTESDRIKEYLASLQSRVSHLGSLVQDDHGLFALYQSSVQAQSVAQTSQRTMKDSLRASEAAITRFSGQVNEFNATINTGARTKIGETTSRAQKWAIVIVGIGFGASVLVGLILAGGISKPMRRLAEQAGLIAQGDLTLSVESQQRGDEIGALSTAFSRMVEGLRNQTRRVTEGVEVLAPLTGEISAVVAQMSQSMAQASSSVAEVTATAEELRQAAMVASEKAKVVSTTSQQAVHASSKGAEATKDTMEKMGLIKDQMASVRQMVLQLNKNTSAIGSITETVQDLADQSNLLAVNASIEAARAGEQGKGFTIVAHEIKSLADQSKDATQQIRGLLGEIATSVSSVVVATERGHEAVSDGVQQSQQSADYINILEVSVGESFQAASVIDASSSQQFSGIDQVVQAMTNIEQVMQQLVAVSGELKNSSQQLSQLGNDLNLLVAQYKM